MQLVLATGYDPDYIRFVLPYAQGLQYLAIQLRSYGTNFLGDRMPEDETFSAIVKSLN